MYTDAIRIDIKLFLSDFNFKVLLYACIINFKVTHVMHYVLQLSFNPKLNHVHYAWLNVQMISITRGQL